MNQGKLDVVKEQTARICTNILAISELKWTGMGEFNSDDHYIYYCGQESLWRNRVALRVNKRVHMQDLIKSMPQPLMLKKLKLTSSVKICNPF